MKLNWKKVGKIAFTFGEQLFPVLSLVEKFATSKSMTSDEKQELALDALRDELSRNLSPAQMDDERLNILIRRLINDGVELNNLIAQLKS